MRVAVLLVCASALLAPARALALPTDPRPPPATFRVGVAVETIDPLAPAYLGGYGAGPAGGTIRRHVNPLTGRPEELTVRAVAIEAQGPGGHHVVELASVDSQGWFAGYQEGPYGISDVRAAAASSLRNHGVRWATSADIVVSSLHEHAVPSLYGIYSPAAANIGYLKQVAAATTRALERAYAEVKPAMITVGTADAPWLGGGNVPEGNEFEGWRRDGSLVALWAREAASGATIATYVSEPAYPNIVFGPNDLIGVSKETLISSDFPAYAEAEIEQRLGGVAILASGSLANQASPLQADVAPSPNLARVDGFRQTRAFNDILQMGSAVANVTFGALALGHPVRSPVVGSSEQAIVAPATNPADAALSYLDVLGNGSGWAPLGKIFTIYPDDRAFTPPYGYGAAFGTWVTTLRIGDLALVTEPGEFFGSIREALSRGIDAPDGVFVIGAAQDFLGYAYPASTTPFTNLGGDELIFGPSATLGDQVVAAGETEARQLGFAVELTSTAETSALEQDYARVVTTGVYLLPSGQAGDLDPRTGTFTPTFVAAASPPRTTMTCDNPALPYSPPGCPLPDPPLGRFAWRFGDGATATTAVEGKARASFSPFVAHTFTSPGTYRVSVVISAAGSSGTVSLPITVNPALHASIVLSGDRAVAVMTGGDGHALFDRWTLADGSSAHGPTIALPASGRLTVTVVDGTGTEATAATTVEQLSAAQAQRAEAQQSMRASVQVGAAPVLPLGLHPVRSMRHRAATLAALTTLAFMLTLLGAACGYRRKGRR